MAYRPTVQKIIILLIVVASAVHYTRLFGDAHEKGQKLGDAAKSARWQLEHTGLDDVESNLESILLQQFLCKRQHLLVLRRTISLPTRCTTCRMPSPFDIRKSGMQLQTWPIRRSILHNFEDKYTYYAVTSSKTCNFIVHSLSDFQFLVVYAEKRRNLYFIWVCVFCENKQKSQCRQMRVEVHHYAHR